MEKSIAEIIGANVKRLRLRAGMSQETLGKYVKRHATFISMVELNKAVPNSDDLYMMSVVFGVNITEMYPKEGQLSVEIVEFKKRMEYEEKARKIKDLRKLLETTQQELEELGTALKSRP